MLTSQDQMTLLRQFRLLYEWHYKLAVSVEALRQLAQQNGLGGQLSDFEQAVSMETNQTHVDMLRAINGIIQRLKVS
jgi:hypothetical protein